MAARRKALLLETYTLFEPEACKGLEGTHYTNCVFDAIAELKQTQHVEHERLDGKFYIKTTPLAENRAINLALLKEYGQKWVKAHKLKIKEAGLVASDTKRLLQNSLDWLASQPVATKTLVAKFEAGKWNPDQKPDYFRDGFAYGLYLLRVELETELQRLQNPAPAQPNPAPVVQGPATANSKPEISVDAAALIEYYTGNTITEQNSVQVAAKYGFTSKAIYTNYRNLLNKNYRQGLNERGKVQARNFLKSLETAVSLLEGEARERAETDLSLYKSSYNEIYG
jgi:hypothetical protein